jgi:hypothetical protein
MFELKQKKKDVFIFPYSKYSSMQRNLRIVPAITTVTTTIVID